LEQLERSVSISLQRGCEHRPQRGVSVLRSILAYSRQVSLDVPRVVRRLVEGRRQQHDEARVFPDEVLVE